jgi:hypothetical protein
MDHVVLGSTAVRNIVEEQISCICGWRGLGYNTDLCPKCGSSKRVERKTLCPPTAPTRVVDLDALETAAAARRDAIEGTSPVATEADYISIRDAYVGATQPATVCALVSTIRELRAGLQRAADYLDGAGFVSQAKQFDALASKEIIRTR